MAQTFTNLLTHIVFSTKDRVPLILPEFRPHLHAYLGGIVRELGGCARMINGTADHVHILAGLPPTLAIADALRVVKANSSRRVGLEKTRHFGWQAGYGAFSVSESKATEVIRYIANQEQHHRKRTFQEEFLAFLKKHNIEYDERYIWK
jgi:putative transposase